MYLSETENSDSVQNGLLLSAVFVHTLLYSVIELDFYGQKAGIQRSLGRRLPPEEPTLTLSLLAKTGP